MCCATISDFKPPRNNLFKARINEELVPYTDAHFKSWCDSTYNCSSDGSAIAQDFVNRYVISY
jgi:hypothetical protein